MSGPDPRTYDYAHPTRTCDIVMKGGITSGVVYPHVVCELAPTYRLHSVGGASAGAIAAAGAAAAEHGRASGGFAKLAALPDWLGSGTNLFSLFQPDRSTRPLFRTLSAGVDGGRTAPLRFLAAGLRNFPLWAAVGAAPGLLLVVFSLLAADGLLRWWSSTTGLLFAVVGLGLGLLSGIYRRATTALPANGFGLCSGFRKHGEPKPLTTWFADLLDDYAGITDPDEPLTFGVLWAGADGSGDAANPRVRLEMMTTNLTNRRAHRLPWDERVFFFDPEEFAELFPARIVRWMKNHAPDASEPGKRDEWRLRRELLEPLLPFPPAVHLPVVVAARMSLSFPLLISAIPLWAVDMGRRDNQAAWDEWREWLRSGGEGDRPKSRPVAERCWFSDGGISSNFPVHFFDAPIPRWPTFAVNLAPFHPDDPKSDDECENVWLPDSNVGGLLESWDRFDQAGGRGSLVGFVSSIGRTMQNRVDSSQMRVPGYRDRIVHISHSEDEGGMNLSMPPEVIGALTERGRCAGVKLVERFARAPASPSDLSWDNHRWIRYRSTLAALAELISNVAKAYSSVPEQPDERTYAELVRRARTAPPRSYRWLRNAQRDLAVAVTDDLLTTGKRLETSSESLDEDAPSPQPEARIVPRI